MKHFFLAIPLPISFGLMCVACFGLLVLLDSVTDRREEQTNLFDQYYTIEPTSLMDSLKNGEMAFTPVSQRPEFVPFDQSVTVDWDQVDYFYIANALYVGILGKTLQGWQLGSMGFALGCSQIQSGFQNGRFGFFSVVKDNNQESRLERDINIDPSDNFVNVSETKYSPKLVELSPIPLNENILSAEEALQRAENAGGKETRLSVTNDCTISLQLTQDFSLWNKKWWWWVNYSGRDDKGRPISIFTVELNPQTGELRP
jgi:hypothetical protein